MAHPQSSKPNLQCDKTTKPRAAARQSVRPIDLPFCVDDPADKIKQPPAVVPVETRIIHDWGGSSAHSAVAEFARISTQLAVQLGIPANSATVRQPAFTKRFTGNDLGETVRERGHDAPD
jgi:hypothetical protein